ncbi:hypothetical protein [Colwellia psychrerythraea]|uniref:Uncharacterized protein n=1 Tax=Colwellia psychrerythraea TaxID=28229 RepID=A0A099KMC9_COLPS|nr:hypothetical protein [Colwellia psychrerythraea]KGJ91919.1 hypothetical protein GAB14E_3076 [Colwellia psychrerythraea]
MRIRNFSRWDSRFFIIAGCFMLINTALLWIRYDSNYQLSILWTAIPAIIGLASAVFGLIKLYPRASANAPLVAKSGAGFALLAATSLSLAAIWIFAVAVFDEGIPDPAPQGLLGLIAIFMIAMVLAFFSNAIAFFRHSGQRQVGYLLTVPLAMWVMMLAVGAIKGLEVGLSLDYYANGLIAAAFLALGFTLRISRSADS